jgi:exopolyphosphatase/guanosine-5'-triphosphate,3'-diphosphate pyrophosphatase
MRVAAVDCGTNSIRLLVADADPGRRTLTDVHRRMEIVRLGEGVDATGRIAPAALERTLRALAGYATLIRESGASAVRMVATSATRDAANAAAFVRGVRDVLGVEPEVVTGEEEAALSFTGATAGLAGRAPAPYLVADIGGGSTEFVLGGNGVVKAAVSVDIGCVRMTERHLRADPPSPAQIAAAAADVDAALEVVSGKVPAGQARTLVGLAGSVTTVAALAMGLPAFDAARIHHSRISAQAVHEQATRLLAMTHAQRAALPVMHPGRVDVIAGGAMVLDHIMSRFGCPDVLVSEHDILDGIAWSLAGGDGW